MESAPAGLRRGEAAAHGDFHGLGVPAISCAICRTPTTRVPACTSRSRSSRRPAASPRRVRRREAGGPAGVRGLGRHAVAPPRGRHRACAVAGAGHSPPAWSCCARCSRRRPRANLNPGKIVAADAARALRATLAAERESTRRWPNGGPGASLDARRRRRPQREFVVCGVPGPRWVAAASRPAGPARVAWSGSVRHPDVPARTSTPSR